jgi:hypothetical protein
MAAFSEVASSKLKDKIEAAFYKHAQLNGKFPKYLIMASRSHGYLLEECECSLIDNSQRKANGTLKTFMGMTVVIIAARDGQAFDWALGS